MSGAAITTAARYRVLHQLASGGMGEIELAIRSEWGFRRIYAIKRLPEAMRQDESARAMFLDEARLAGLVRHPNVVSVLDVGEDERGPFLVMDFVEGISAGALLRWAGKNGVSLPVQLVARLIREIAMGLHAAHELCDHDGTSIGLVHRDVSPQNILIGFDGMACIADFGIAKASGRTTRTTTGLLKGKAGYMSPEQLRFEEPDRRSDIFSLAVVFYELLAGRRLYRSENDVATARRILNEPPPDIDDVRGDVPAEIVELLVSCLSKIPAARPSSASEVARRLDVAIAALVGEEGAIDVAEYIREHFAGRRAEIQTLLAEARTSAGVQAMKPLPEPPPSAITPRRAVLAAVAVAGSLVLAIWGFTYFGTAPAVTEEAAADPAAPVPEVAVAEPAIVAAPPAEEEPVLEAPSATPEIGTAAPAPERPRRRGGSRSGEAARETGDDLFRWE